MKWRKEKSDEKKIKCLTIVEKRRPNSNSTERLLRPNGKSLLKDLFRVKDQHGKTNDDINCDRMSTVIYTKFD